MHVLAGKPKRVRRRVFSGSIQRQTRAKLACDDKHMLKQFIAPGKYIGFNVKPKCTTVFNHLAATHYTDNQTTLLPIVVPDQRAVSVYIQYPDPLSRSEVPLPKPVEIPEQHV